MERCIRIISIKSGKEKRLDSQWWRDIKNTCGVRSEGN